MYDFNKKTMPTDMSWFSKRYNALLVGFPNEITQEELKKDGISSCFDSEEAYEALKSAHKFLTNIAAEMLHIPKSDEDRMSVIEKVLLKIDLFWGLAFYGELYKSGNEYCFSFKKTDFRSNKRTLPKSYSQAFKAILDNGCFIQYFKGDKEIKDYKSCDKGIFHFDDRLTALGIYIFIKKCAQKRWYWDEDKGGSYSGAYDPVIHCSEPYHRIDMRIFICGERLKYDIYEQLSGYSDEIIAYFKMIYDFVKINFPHCLPSQGFYNYICCSVNFMMDLKHAMLGQVGLGHNEHFIGFYGAMSGEVREAAIAELGYENMKQSDWFDINNEEDAKYAIQIMKIKAKYGRNVILKSSKT